MGVNIQENISEGKSFEQSMGLGVENKSIDQKKSEIENHDSSEWKRYIDENVLPTGSTSGEDDKHETFIRPSKTEYYLDMAKTAAKRGTCLRRKFGAIIVKNDRIVSTGYVGAPKGRKNCCDIGYCFRMKNNIPSGTMYEKCRSIHAEMNAVINASKEEMENATMYLMGIENDGSINPNADCCAMCKRAIINSGISQVIIGTPVGHKTIDVKNWVEDDDSLDINHEGY